MKFEDVFPYEKDRYPQLIEYFEESLKWGMPEVLHYFSIGGFLRLDYCGLGIPHGEDELMREGPYAWAGNPFTIWRPEDDEIIDFKMFIVCCELAVRVYIFNHKDRPTENLFKDLKTLREKYTDVSWIKEHCYGEAKVCDDQLVLTGEYHGKEWGEEWYEKYGKFLRFDDIDEIVNEAWNNALKKSNN